MGSRFKRKYNIRKEYKVFYIFTEGEKTEVNYFESKKREIRKPNIKIEIKGTGYNTKSLVDYALNYIKKENIILNDLADSDECWVVFDKDDFIGNFDNAITKAKAKKLKVAYPNESFELWYLLHFSFLNSALHRTVFISKLNKIIKAINGKDYNKSFDNMYCLINHLEKDAIKHAKKLLEIHKHEPSFIQKNPSTTVHLLVESLNKLNT